MIWLSDAEHGRMIAHKVGVGYDPERDNCVSKVTSEGKLVGGVIFTNYTGRSVQLHMAGGFKGWATLELIWLAFDYPFNQLKVEQVLGVVASTDTEVLAIDERLGFREVTRIPGAVPGGDLVVLSMVRSACKWLKYGPRFNSAADLAA